MSRQSIMARYNAELEARHSAEQSADQIVEGFMGAYQGAYQGALQPSTSRYSTPINPNAADLEVYAQSARANAEQIDNTSFLGRLLGL